MPRTTVLTIIPLTFSGIFFASTFVCGGCGAARAHPGWRNLVAAKVPFGLALSGNSAYVFTLVNTPMVGDESVSLRLRWHSCHPPKKLDGWPRLLST